MNAGRIPYFTSKWLANQNLPHDVNRSIYLDIGCGGGIATQELANNGFNITGIDQSNESINTALEHARQDDVKNIHYVTGSAYSLPFPDEHFDGVVSSDVLEHILDLPSMLKEVRRVMKPGGRFVFDSINRTWKSWIIMILLAQKWSFGWVLPRNAHDWRLFITPDEMQKVLKNNGFEIAGRNELKGLQATFEWRPWVILGSRGGLWGLFADFIQTEDTAASYLWYATAI